MVFTVCDVLRWCVSSIQIRIIYAIGHVRFSLAWNCIRISSTITHEHTHIQCIRYRSETNELIWCIKNTSRMFSHCQMPTFEFKAISFWVGGCVLRAAFSLRQKQKTLATRFFMQPTSRTKFKSIFILSLRYWSNAPHLSCTYDSIASHIFFRIFFLVCWQKNP